MLGAIVKTFETFTASLTDSFVDVGRDATVADIIVSVCLRLMRVHILEPSAALVRTDGLSSGTLGRNCRRLDPRPVVSAVIVA